MVHSQPGAFPTFQRSRVRVTGRLSVLIEPFVVAAGACRASTVSTRYHYQHRVCRTCLTAWTGPTGSPYDFQPGNVAVEIKTTSSVNPQSIRISNEYQLDDAGLAGLFVCLFLLDIRPEGEAPFETLNQLIGSILDQILGQAAVRNQFRLRLYEAGYHPAQRLLYDQPAYRVRETRCYRVAEGFPRLRASNLPPGINATQYNIGLTDCEPFGLTDDALLRELV